MEEHQKDLGAKKQGNGVEMCIDLRPFDLVPLRGTFFLSCQNFDLRTWIAPQDCLSLVSFLVWRPCEHREATGNLDSKRGENLEAPPTS